MRARERGRRTAHMTEDTSTTNPDVGPAAKKAAGRKTAAKKAATKKAAPAKRVAKKAAAPAEAAATQDAVSPDALTRDGSAAPVAKRAARKRTATGPATNDAQAPQLPPPVEDSAADAAPASRRTRS